jgi:hypothetical protein
VIHNRFEMGPEGWCSYDYHASMVSGGTNFFVLAAWEAQGGVESPGYIWTDNTRWSADTPERPLSILPLIFYRSWVGKGPVDLRDVEASFRLRGEGLALDGAVCLFWVHALDTRWHLASQPIDLGDGHWPGQPTRLVLANDESRWHRSWSSDPAQPTALDKVLNNAESYGFSFVGFSREVTGRLCLDSFRITR